MKVSVIGGGPGGSYAALLVKKAHPEWTVDVYERYPPATTYGWGIVLPEKVYPTLREADEPTCERIEAANTKWDPIDNYHRGQRIRCGGHPYTSVNRATLLEILQGRCEELGVEMHYEAAADPLELKREADVLVGADGIASETREAFGESFGADLTRHSDVYAWFGTDRSFEALSHIYLENEHGVWHGASYPGSTDTFIVDADEATWAAAGFDEASESTYIDYLEDLFSDYLEGHDLRSKEDRWRHFVTVENDRWHHENVVLLGDSAATAHYTIGSGTRMAMESAIALAASLERRPDDPTAAFERYHDERKPHVEALQSAAALSVTHFENLERYVDLDPMQLAFLYLTRTGYNTYEELRRRDPAFVDRVDRWFADAFGTGSGGTREIPQPVDQPFALGELTLPNRLVAMTEPTARPDGTLDDAGREAILALAGGGAGTIVVGPLAVSGGGRTSASSAVLDAEVHVEAWTDAIGSVDDLSGGGQATVAELVHAGPRGVGRSGEATPAGSDGDGGSIGPSAVPAGPDGAVPRAMTGDEMDRVRESFLRSARLADEAGFDALSVHAGHGYLLSAFLSPLTNERDDEYGGSLEDRLRYPLEVVEAVRAAWPDGKPLAVTLQASDGVEGGFDVEDAFVAARALREAGVDLIAPVVGGAVPESAPPTADAWVRLYSHWIKHEVEIPTLSTNAVDSRDEANTMVASGRADLCRVSAGADLAWEGR